MNNFDITQDMKVKRMADYFVKTQKYKLLIKYLCNCQYNWTLPDPFWKFSGKISQVYFPINRNSKKALWGPL